MIGLLTQAQYRMVELAACVALVAFVSLAMFGIGWQLRGARCELAQAKAQVTAEQDTKTEARKDIARATRTGQAREADRAELDKLFTRLAEEARHDPPAPVDAAACELPAERLRRWAAANAGLADQGAAAREPDGAAAAPAAAGLGQDARPGGQPPAGGAGLPPAGQPAVPAAGVPAGPAPRVQPLDG